MSKRKLAFLGLIIALFFGFVQTSFAAEKLVGLQSAPTIAMAIVPDEDLVGREGFLK